MIRDLRDTDLADVGELEVELFGQDAVSVDGLAELVAGPGRRGWVLEEDGALTGYALTGVVGDFAELLRIGVRPRSRRRGSARTLLALACATAVEDGVDRLLLEVGADNQPALALYESVGFEVIDRRVRYYRGGSDALVMELPLPAADRPSGRMGP